MSTQATLDQIQELYIAYYGRPADADGLTYWAAQLDAQNGNLTSIINAFATSAESVALYGANASAEDLVTAIYQNVLHRAPDAAGLEFYAQALKAGTITAGSLALSVLNGVQNDDIATVQNELAAAHQFTAGATNYGGDTASAIGRTFLSQVSSDSAANEALLSHLTSYINATSAATSDPSQFDGKIAGGVLTDPTIVDQYASGTTPSTGGNDGDNGGDNGGTPGGDPVTGTVAELKGNPPTGAYIVVDSAANILAAATGAIVTGATAVQLSSDASVSVADAQALAATPAFSVNGHALTLVDSIEHLTGNTDVAGATAYVVADTAAHILSNLAGDLVAGAQAVELSADATGSVSDALALASTHGFSLGGHSLTLIDSIANLTGHTTEAGASSYIILDTAENIAAGAESPVVAGAQSVELLSDAVVTVAQADALASLSAFDMNGHALTLADTIGNLDGHTSTAGATSYVVVDTADNIIANATSDVVTGAQAVELSADASVSVEQAQTLAATSSFSVNGHVLTLVDSIEALTDNTTVAGATAYTVVDTAANIVAGASGALVTDAQAVQLSADASVSVAQSQALAGLAHFDANGHTLTLADTIDNLTGNTQGFASYDVVDTVANILAGAAGDVVTNAHAVELSADASVSVEQALALANVTNFDVNGHTLTLADTIDNLTGNTTAGGVTSYDVQDTLANILANAASDIVTGAHAVQLSADASITVAQAQALESVANFDVHGHTLTLVDTIDNLTGATVAGFSSYDVQDTAANILAHVSADVVTNAHAVELSADASVSVAQAEILNGTANFGLGGHALNLVDTIGNLDGHTTEAGASSYDVVDTAAAIVAGASGSIVSGAHSVGLSEDATVSVEQAHTLGSTNGFNLDGHSLSLSDTISNLDGHTTEAGATSYTVLDTASNVQGDLAGSSGVVAGAQSVTVTMDQDSLDLSGFTGATTVVEGSSNETITFGSHGLNVSDVLSLSTNSGQQDIVTNFGSMDVLQSQGGALHAGGELAAENGIVATLNYGTSADFITAVMGAQAAAAGDTVAWSDGQDTYVAVFHGTEAGQAHIVELVGVASASAVTQAGTGVHVG
ncbi:DUF4214 domain-containing protein [Paraburkholderia unamae]|uniref:Uncharacterized protein DUF4214 n=1 Tax=Paraburkholderia unamae TaxID=219649 RepID=A0ABX5KEL1_9BURK|nr:DUF4214 domain-containing protein [Paraburkholderia unamae]PVX76295.1 uncharacterized protein DUF4214 [Paraburkholderia unamae]